MRSSARFETFRRCLLILCVLPALAEMPAATYFVTAQGSDTNPGTHPSRGWRTLAKVNSFSFAPGDTLLFHGGEIFPGSLYLDSLDGNSAAVPFTIGSYGTGRATLDAGNSYGIYAYNTQGIRIQNLLLTGSGMNTNRGNGLEFYADVPGDRKFAGITLEDIEVRYFGRVGVRIGGWNGNTGYEGLTLNRLIVHDNLWDGIQIYGFFSTTGYPNRNVRVTHCASFGNPGIADPGTIRGNGIVVSNTDGALVEHCTAHDNGSANIHCGGPGGIWTYDCNNIVIQFCESYRNRSGSPCDGLGFDLDGGTQNSVLQYNYSHDNDGGGFLLGQMANGRPWKNNTCRYNISENDARTNAGAITLFKEGSDTVMDSVFIYNNTVLLNPASANAGESAFKITEWYTGIQHVFVCNNIFITTGGVPLVYVPENYNAFLAGNLYWSSGAPFTVSWLGRQYGSLDAWRSATGTETVDGNNTGLEADPLVLHAGGGGVLDPDSTRALRAYTIDASSPARDAGLVLARMIPLRAGSSDYWGNNVPFGAAPDIGAHEFSMPTDVLHVETSCAAIALFPNPATQYTMVSISSPLQHGCVTLHDARGAELQRYPLDGSVVIIDRGTLSPGCYLCRIYDGSGRLVARRSVLFL